jgi:hypothetical protein
MDPQGTEIVRQKWLRKHVAVFLLPLAVCTLVILRSNLPSVRAMQDEHVVAPQSSQEMGETGTKTYVGEAKCLTCHAGFASQASTGMRLAAFNPAKTLPLDYSTMAFRDGGYKVTIEKNKEGAQMTATEGSAKVSATIRWIFGQGVSGQTFILEHDGRFYESRASYYTALGNLDLTIGHSAKPPFSPMAALGRLLPTAEVTKCFSCHTSEDVFAGKLEVTQAHPGVTCENCHGAGSEHAAKVSAPHSGQSHGDESAIFNPGMLPPADLNDFCGSCHRTTSDVIASGVRDIRNIRFQPYRLENSRCYDPSDARITCIACHDPHRNLETTSLSYDSKCLACHAAKGMSAVHATAPACPRATKDCVTCHMPKLNLPGAHFAFTDHYIRVVQPGKPYPD